MKTKINFTLIKYFFVIFLLFTATFLRLYQLNINPPSLTPDEAAIGYNAYSILKTGKDEHGELFPIIFKSFDDYKPGLYVYFTIPFVAAIGLNEWSVRLPSAIAGIFAVFLIYKIVKTLSYILSGTDKNNELTTSYFFLPAVTSFVLAINPWHIAFSRGAWEANLSLTLTLTGILFFLKAIQNTKNFIVSAIFFSLTLLTYQGAKLSTLIVIFVLILVFSRDVLNTFKEKFIYTFFVLIISLLICLPVISSLVLGKTGRLEVFSVFSYPRSEEYLNQFLSKANENRESVTYYSFHNEPLNFARGIAGRWFNHFSGRYLFFEGDWQNLRHLPPNHGVLLIVDSILLVAGIIGLVKTNNRKFQMFVILWLVLAPLPAALSRDQVQAVRSLNMVIPLIITSSLGLLYLLNKTKNLAKVFTVLVYGLFTIAYLLSLIYFLDAYFVHQPIHNAKYWQYGYKQAIQSIKPYVNSSHKIIFQQSYAQPYIYYLFYIISDNSDEYDPTKIYSFKLTRYKESELDVSLVKSIDNISFEYFGWPKVAAPGTVLVGDLISIPPDFDKWSDYELIERIYNPDGTISFTIVKVKE